MPIAHGEGCYFADDATLDALEGDGQVLFRYVRADGTQADADGDPANPNGSLRAIAGVLNARGNVAGLMPHPERAADGLLGSDDGLPILRSLVEAAARAKRRARSPSPSWSPSDDRRRATPDDPRSDPPRRRRRPLRCIARWD